MKRSLGVCYYPEHWPQSVWEHDARRMASAGLKWVRIGEFAWSRLEPSEGCNEFDWLDTAIDVLGQNGLSVILGTPTATPPRWMIDKHPDMLAQDRSGRPRKFGSRRHYCFSSQSYLQECRKIVTKLARRYGKNKWIHAWQIDNEYGCHDTTLSYSDAAKQAFRDWLGQKYQSISALNDAWGNSFWSMTYDNFGQVDLPNLTVTEPNPAHVMDFRRFSSEQLSRFNRVQTDILRQYTSADLLHNYMGREVGFDHYDVGQDLDIASWDSYPIGFLSDRLEASPEHRLAYVKQGDPDMQAFHHDLYRSVGRGRWWVMEQQPGPVNWAPFNPAPLPGMVRLWSWEAFAHGAEAVCYFRWRQLPHGQEQMHAGLLRADDQPTEAMSEIAQIAEELSLFPDVDTVTSDVALVFDYESAWAWNTQPQGQDFDYFRLCFCFYRALRRAGLSVDIVSASDNALDQYAVIFAPGLMTIPSQFPRAENGFAGTVVFGPRTNLKDEKFHTKVPLGPAIPKLDIITKFVESLPPNASIELKGGGQVLHWFEALEGGADVSLRTIDGRPVIASHDQTHYLAGWLNSEGLDRVVELVCKQSNIQIQKMPEGVRRRETNQAIFTFNYTNAPVSFDCQSIPAAGVAWKKAKAN